jgi:hypothetical protein
VKAYIIREETNLLQEVEMNAIDRNGFPPGITLISEKHLDRLIVTLKSKQAVLDALGAHELPG